MKTIIARFEDMKKDPAKALEDGISFNKVEEALSTLGIALRDTAGEFRPLQDVFDELGMKWETLTRNQQAYIATIAAGSRQQSRFLAMMNNYGRTLDLITESQNSAGAAARQYATYQDSIAAAQARLTASWEKFYSKIVDNGAIKLAINGLSSLIEILSHIPPAITAIGASIGALSLQNLLQKNGGLTTIIGKLLGKNAEKSISDVGINLAEKFINKFKDKSISEIADTTKIWKTLNKSAEQSTGSLEKLSTSLSKVGSGFVTVGKTILGFIAGNWQIIAVLAIVGASIWALNRYLTINKRKYEESIETIKKYNEEISQMQNRINDAENLFEVYDKLINKVNRTAEEQNELNSTIKAISEIYPNAITYVDEYGNEHLENANILKEEIELEKKLAKEKTRASLQEKENLLNNTDRKNWKKEDFSDIGFSNAQVDAYFKNQEDLNYYKKYYNPDKNKASYYNLEAPIESNLINLDSLQFAINEKEITEIEAATLAIKDINKYIDLFKLKIDKLDEDSSWENVVKKVDEITGFKNNLPKLINDLEDEQNKIVARLQKDNSLQLSFLDLNFGNKAGTATAKRAVAAQLQSYFSSMGIEAFESFKNSLPTDSLTEYIQNIIDNIDDADEALEVKNLFEEAFNLSTSEDRLLEIYNELGEKLGWKAGEGFQESFQKSIEENRQKIREDLEGAVTSTFQGRGKLPTYFGNYSNERLQSINELGEESQDLNFYEAAQMASFYEQAKKLQEEAIMNGSIEGLEESLKKIDTSSLPDDLQKIWETIIKAILNNTISEITEEAFFKLQQESQDFISNTKKSLNSIQSEGKVSAKDYGLEEEDYSFGVYFDPTSGEKVVSTARVLLDIEEENNKKLEDTKQIYKNNLELIEQIKNKGESATSAERKRLKELENENDALIAQYKYYQKIENITLESGWNTSIKLAKNYQSQLQTISNLEKAMAEQGGVLFLDDMEEAMSILPEFQNRFTEVSDNTYTISAENIEAMKKEVKSQYDLWLAQEKAKATVEYENAVTNYELIKTLAEQEGIIDKNNTDQFIENNKTELQSTKSELEQSLNASYDEIKQELNAHSEKDIQMVQMFNKALNEMGKNYELFIEDIKSGNIEHIYDELYKEIQSQPLSTTTEITIQTELLDDLQDPEKQEERKRILTAALEEAAARVRAAWKKLTSLKEINVPELEKLKHQLEGVSEGGKEAEETLEALADAVEDLTDALEDLDKLLIDVKRDLKDITIDYNPFTDLFEAWEAEWDYYYNIKNLIKQLDTQSTMIDNVISADYTTAEEKLNAYDAKVGNLTWKMATNDAYITTLRAGIAQRAKELEKEFNEYYNVDYRMGGWQVFQRDITLKDWEETINAAKEYSFELSELINTQENELNLLEANQEALEQQRSAYENILSTVDSLIDTLSGNENITVDLSELQGIKVELEAAINDESVEGIKEQVRNLNDYIQELNIQLDLNDKVVVEGLEKGYDKLKDEIDGAQELIDALNEAIIEQQEYVQQFSEAYSMYVDTAISTQQELYNAIVEQYQDEINKKKEQYAYLKQLDNDYLQSVKDNINKERKAREDANKQQDFQKNLQRAQLLQQDTSGAYRNELANLNKEIENQRQDLYDDLVDKQVEALEKEIEKRHELYDLEVSAMEERLAYMQENAILLWDMVNGIVAGGATEMMALLENTTNYINQNELAKEKQRRQWEFNTQATYKGVIEGEIDSLENRIKAEKEQLNTYKELKDAIELSTAAYLESKEILEEENVDFQKVMNSLMQTWTDMTSDLTGYNENWETTLTNIRTAMEKDINALSAMGDEGGSIYLLNEKLKQTANEMYQNFIEERTSYKETLEAIIGNIQEQITTAINNAAGAIQNAANNIHFSAPQPSTGPSTGPGNGPSNNSNKSTVNPGGGSDDGPKYYQAYVSYYDGRGEAHQANSIMGKTIEEVMESVEMRKKRILDAGGTWIGLDGPYPRYLKGGFANFTGPAWLDGTKSQPEAVLNAKQTRLFTSMVSSLERTAANNSNINSTLGSSYNIGDINTNINVEKLDNETDIDRVARQVENRIMKSIRNRVVVSIA